jgi:predicted dinucleotide-binding enzyme
MRIGIIGSGKIGGTAARLFVDAGHDVVIATPAVPRPSPTWSRSPEAKGRVSSLIEKIGFAPIDAGSLAEGGRRQRPGEARELVGEPG